LSKESRKTSTSTKISTSTKPLVIKIKEKK